MIKIKILLPLKWWFKFYGQLTIPLSVLFIIIGWRWFSPIGIPFAIVIDIIMLIITIHLYKIRTFKELCSMLEWVKLYWREAERWKELGIKEMEQNLNDEAAVMMIKIGRRFGYELWDYCIAYGKKMDGVKIDEMPWDKGKKD